MISPETSSQSATIRLEHAPAGFRVQLVAGLFGCLVGLCMFGIVADCVQRRAGIAELDVRLADSLHQHARSNPAVVAVFQVITSLGSTPGLTAFAIAVALALATLRRRLLARLWLIVVSGGLLHHALKALFPRLRPQFSDPFVTEASSSFPSGHSMAALIGYGLLAYLVWLAVPRRKLRLAAIAVIALVVIAIGFSRLYLGAHYLTDVIGGYAAGTVWLSASISGIELIRRTGRLDAPRHIEVDGAVAA